MKSFIRLFPLIVLLLLNQQAFAGKSTQTMLKDFHKFGITHCDEFIQKNTATPGSWKYFINKHPGGIDGPSTEVALTQISGSRGQSFKTDYTFIQTLKKCFLHKQGQITAFENCDKAVDKNIWKVQFNLPDYDYKRYKDKTGIVLYAKDIEINGNKACLLDYEFRVQGEHSIYRKL
ncbi:hypothetical protein [Thiomicrorhabdus sp. Milos-T2]|uniref:hypothetical protein n=1 Tax=Thiomicrorhabdus sp. Milos-T2 TaxID=90814 RepID=UPI000493D0B1|nr:hypothetical protein [Thiomicrorhabdus sp. Milos-T2]